MFARIRAVRVVHLTRNIINRGKLLALGLCALLASSVPTGTPLNETTVLSGSERNYVVAAPGPPIVSAVTRQSSRLHSIRAPQSKHSAAIGPEARVAPKVGDSGFITFGDDLFGPSVFALARPGRSPPSEI